MGRRALRKIDPVLDLSRNLRTFEQLPRPWNPEALFGRGGPVELEVGSGKGLFLRTAAAAHPEINYLGVEIAPRYARFAAAGLAKRSLTNAIVAIAHVGDVFDQLLPDESLAAIHIYFPDPWWKRRHQKRRIINEPFVRQLERTLRFGGSLHFWSDVEEYFDLTLKLLAEHTRLEGPLPVPEATPTHDMDYRTHFERRTRLHGQQVYRAEFRKAARSGDRPILRDDSATIA